MPGANAAAALPAVCYAPALEQQIGPFMVPQLQHAPQLIQTLK